MKKGVLYIVLLVLAILALWIKRCNESGETKKDIRKDESPSTVNRDRGFDRRTSYLRYTNHADCRMECRHISKEEVEDIMKNGKINYNKSNIRDARCPTYAVEGSTKDDQRVRIVFGQCNDFTNVITVIDLGTEWSCDCPGDDKKYENRN